MASLEEISTPASADGTSSQDRSLGSSAQGSRSNSRPPKKNARIHWHSQGEQIDTRQQKSKFNVRDHSASPPKRDGKKPLPRARRDSLQKPRAGNTSSAAQSPSFPQNVNEALRRTSPRPSILRQASNDSNDSRNSSDEENKRESPNSIGKAVAQRTAESKAQRLSRDLGIRSAPGSRLPSPVSSPPPSPPPEDQYTTPIDLDSIPLQRLESKRRSYGIEDDTESEESEEDDTNTHKRKKHNRFYKAARRLVNHHTTRKGPQLFRVPAMSSQTSLRSGQVTPEAAKDPNNYVPRPKQYREGILSSLMRLYNGQVPSAASAGHPLEHTRNNLLSRSRESLFGSIRSPLSSGRVTPDQRKQSDPVIPKHQKWYVKDPSPSSTPSIANLVNSSSMLAQPTAANITKAEESTPPAQGNKAGMRPVPMQKPSASGSNEVATRLFNKLTGAVPDDEFKIHLHIADVMKRHQYLLKLCKMLMSYGAPTHRLEGNSPQIPSAWTDTDTNKSTCGCRPGFLKSKDNFSTFLAVCLFLSTTVVCTPLRSGLYELPRECT